MGGSQQKRRGGVKAALRKYSTHWLNRLESCLKLSTWIKSWPKVNYTERRKIKLKKRNIQKIFSLTDYLSLYGSYDKSFDNYC